MDLKLLLFDIQTKSKLIFVWYKIFSIMSLDFIKINFYNINLADSGHLVEKLIKKNKNKSNNFYTIRCRIHFLYYFEK